MKNWWAIFVIGILLVIVSLLFIKPNFLGFLSSQGTININSLTGEFDPIKTKAFFNNQLVSLPSFLPKEEGLEVILGESVEPKRIEIDLTNQRLYAYEGNQKVYDFVISSGKWGRTPTGNFRIWIKLGYTLMTGGSKILGTYYYLPNVPYTMFFYNENIPKWRGFGIHGTYWHNNFGHPMSHGCINMRTEDAKLLYYWARPDLQGKNSVAATNDNSGTEVIIYGTTPLE